MNGDKEKKLNRLVALLQPHCGWKRSHPEDQASTIKELSTIDRRCGSDGHTFAISVRRLIF